MKVKHCLAGLVVFVTSVSLSACSSMSYYTQAIVGQVGVLRARQPIESLLDNPSTSPEVRQKLQLALDIRRYASQELGLPDNGSYTSYADLKRPFVVWNVVAAEPYSLNPLQHCFPFAGCVVYRGFFKPKVAQEYADKLQEQGYETYLYGVRAYSTLGWFDDPLLNTMLEGTDDLYLAALIFHELTHQVVYVKGASEFNESFATAIEAVALQQWLQDNGQGDREKIYQQRKQREKQFLELVVSFQKRLADVYKGKGTHIEQKQTLFMELREAYQTLRDEQWQGYSGYDHWFDDQLNNAKLAVVSTYHGSVEKIVNHYLQTQKPIMDYLSCVQNAELTEPKQREQFFSTPESCH